MDALTRATKEYEKLIRQALTLILSTLDAEGIPQATPAPFIYDNLLENLYVFVSELAPHTAYLKQERTVQILIVEDETHAHQPFARKRISLRCEVTHIERNTPIWTQKMQQFRDRFANVIPVLERLPDFRMFRLSPVKGRLILGFGAAWSIFGNDIKPIGPDDLS